MEAAEAAEELGAEILADSILPEEERYSFAARDDLRLSFMSRSSLFTQLDDGFDYDDAPPPVVSSGEAKEEEEEPTLLQPRGRIKWEGYLQKRSDWLKHWETFYFVLNENTLTCYPSEDEAHKYPGTGKIKDGIFSFTDKVLMKSVYDIPSTSTFNPLSPPPQYSSMNTTGIDRQDTIQAEESTAVPSSPVGTTTVDYRFDIEIQNGKRLHFSAPNEATKQVWMHLAADGIAADFTDSVGLVGFYAGYEFLLASLCQINDNAQHSTKRRKPTCIIGSGLAMPGATILPKMDHIISRFFSILDPEVVVKSNYLPTVPFSGTFRGHYGVLEYFTIMSHAMQCGNFHVVKMSMEGRLAVVSGVEALEVRTSSRPFTQQWVHKLHFRGDGRISRIDVIGDTVASSIVFKPQGFTAALTLPPLSEVVRESLCQNEITVQIDQIEQLQVTGEFYLECHLKNQVKRTRNVHVGEMSSVLEFNQDLQFTIDYLSRDDNFHLKVELHAVEDSENIVARTRVNVAYFLNRTETGPQSYILSNAKESFIGKLVLNIDTCSITPSSMSRASSIRRSRSNRPTMIASTKNFKPSFRQHPSAKTQDIERKKIIIADTVFSLHPKYQVIKVVGKGTYGVVVAASDLTTGETFAIKKISNFSRHPKLIALTLREIKLMRHLGEHPCLMGIYDVQYSQEDLYITQPLVETDLCRLIHSKEHLSDAHIQYLVYQMLCGIQYMHSGNVLHRDLKPSNVLVNSDCSIKICDFGLARHVNSEIDQALSEYVVTRWYRAPELLLANVYEKSIDIWSIGCIFAELLGRHVMFPGRSYVNQLKLIIQVVGTPETFSFCDNPSARRFAGRQFLAQGHKYPKVPWNTIFPTSNPDGLDLLDKLLQFDPRKRITAAEALEHPYFDDWRDPELEITRDEVREQTNFDYKAISKAELQNIVRQEVDFNY